MHAACLVLAATVAATTAEPSVAELNTGAQESNPFWTSDGLILYFDSDRAGSRELWVATRPHLNDAFSPAVMVAGIAAVGENKDPWLSADGRRLYFSSSRAGSFELFMAERP